MSRTSSAATSPAPLARRYPTNAQRHGQNSRSLPTNDSAVPPLRSVSVDGYSSDSDYDELDKRRARQLERANTLSKEYVEDEETAVLKKLDKRLTLFLAFLYLLSFLDRSNIGNARIAGLEKTLQLSDREFDYCLVAFYVTYIAFEWMILLYSIIPPHIYISLCVLAWGIVASLQSVVSSFGQLLALRATLGITEAAFGPGVPFYMSFFYRRSELAYRVGLQISAAPLATSFASTLAWAIVKFTQNGPIEPWRALFLFEGFPSIITAILAWYTIPDSPSSARWLNARQRKVAQLRLQAEQIHEHNTHSTGVSRTREGNRVRRMFGSQTIRTLMSPIAWLQALIFLSINVSFASLPVFLPTIINSMHFSALTSQILSAPPYLLTFAFVLFIGRLSDSVKDSRGICLMACSGMSAISYFFIALFGKLESTKRVSAGVSIIVRYAAVYGAAMGLFSSVVLIITWNLNNQPSKKEKGLAMMIMNIVGQCGPLIGVNLFPQRDRPHYVSGMLISGCFMTVVVVLAGLLRLQLNSMNRSRRNAAAYELMPADAQDSSLVEAEGLITGSSKTTSEENVATLFRYML